LALVTIFATHCASSEEVGSTAEVDTVSQALLTTYTADSAAETSQTVTVNTGVGVPGTGTSGLPPGVCFFKELRGGFGGAGDSATISNVSGQWVLKAKNGYSLINGPKAVINCLLLSDIVINPVRAAQFTTQVVGPATAKVPSAGFVYVPNTPGGAAPIPNTQLSIFSSVNGRIATSSNYDKAQFTPFYNGLGGAAGTVFARTTSSDCPAGNSNPWCFLEARGFTFPNPATSIAYAQQDFGTFTTFTSTQKDIPLFSATTSFCFVTGIAYDMRFKTQSVKVTSGNADGAWHLVINSASGTAAGGSAACVYYGQ
jgi:hypothetical protein